MEEAYYLSIQNKLDCTVYWGTIKDLAKYGNPLEPGAILTFSNPMSGHYIDQIQFTDRDNVEMPTQRSRGTDTYIITVEN